MASRYDALAEHLQQQSGTRYTMSFADIERVIGHKLPPSSKPNHRGFRTWRQRPLPHQPARAGPMRLDRRRVGS